MTEPIEDWIRDTEKRRKKLAKLIIFVISAVGAALCLIALMWINDWWPMQLLPWIELERM